MSKPLTFLFSAALLAGCASTPLNISPLPPSHYQKLGHVSGEACGALGIASPAIYFIPMGLNSRVESAYQEALSKAPGATGLIDVEYQESWFWWILATSRCTTVSGEAIKEVKS